MHRRTVIVGGLAFFTVASVGHAQFDALGLLGRSLGLSKEQTEGGLGSILTLAQEKLVKGDFDKVAAAIPGASKYLEQAKSLGAVTGPLKDLAGLKGALGKLGIDEATASKFLSAMPDVVSKLGGGEAGELLGSVLGG
jgi:hypothetical protein